MIWPGLLAEYFVDLKPYFPDEVSLEFPAVAGAYTVDHKLVAKAYRAACTTDIFLFDRGQKLVYRGQFDDSRPGNGNAELALCVHRNAAVTASTP